MPTARSASTSPPASIAPSLTSFLAVITSTHESLHFGYVDSLRAEQVHCSTLLLSHYRQHDVFWSYVRSTGLLGCSLQDPNNFRRERDFFRPRARRGEPRYVATQLKNNELDRSRPVEKASQQLRRSPSQAQQHVLNRHDLGLCFGCCNVRKPEDLPCLASVSIEIEHVLWMSLGPPL